MKKLILKSVCIFGVFALGFSTMSLREAPGSGGVGSSSHTCYDTFKLGNEYYNVNCNNCVAKRNSGHYDESTCKTT